VTLTQYEEIDHPDNSDTVAPYDDQFAVLGADLVTLTATATITDEEGDSATDSETIDLGGNVRFADDGPAINVTKGSDAAVLLTTQDAETDGDPTAFDTAVSAANFGGVFAIGSQSHGADGAGTLGSLSYALDLVPAEGTDSGLDTDGASIFLHTVGGAIVGSTTAVPADVNAGNTVFSIAVAAGTGVVTLTQYEEIDHPDNSDTVAPYDDQFAVLGADLVTLTATATITDEEGDSATDSETIDLGGNVRFADDGPTATPNTNSGVEATADNKSVNLVVIFDRSGSMNDDPSVDGFSTRIDLARAAVASMLEGLGSSAEGVNLLVVDFSSDAATSGWTTIDGANTYLAGLVASGLTDYDAAVALAQTAFASGTPSADQNLLLFLSDGEPTDDNGTGTNGLVDAEITAWETFLTDNDMPAFAVGVGTGVNTDNLAPIAFDPAPGTQPADTPVVFTDEGDLLPELLELIVGSFLSSFDGNLLSESVADTFGADGAGVPPISALSTTVGVTGSSLAFTVASSTPIAGTTRLTGSNGGDDYWQLDVNTTTGEYDLTLLLNFPHSTPDGTATLTFSYTIKDGDGDTSTSTLAVSIDDLTTATAGGLPIIAGTNGNDTGGSALNGTSDAEIIGGDDGNDALNGLGGDDFLYGGDGTDTLNGGAANDILNGGAGNDTYTFTLTDGTDIIGDSGGTDAISVTAGGATLSSLNFERLDGDADGSLDDLRIIINSQQITVENHYFGSSNVESITFAGGASFAGYALGTGSYLLGADSSSPLTGPTGAAVIASSTAGETLDGGTLNDLLFGNSNGDTLNGGAGKDLLIGGAGDDLFDYNLASESGLGAANWDVIADFEGVGATVADRIDLAGIDADETVGGGGSGGQTFAFIGTAAFTLAGQLRVATDGAGGTLVQGSTDADAAAEFEIQVVGVVHTDFVAADFIL